MQTAIQIDDNRFIIMTQQYITGLYVAVYSANENWQTIGAPGQSVSDKPEKHFHKTLQKNAKAKGYLNESHSTIV